MEFASADIAIDQDGAVTGDAKLTARLDEVRDFPSPALGLEMVMVMWPVVLNKCARFTRMVRNASMNWAAMFRWQFARPVPLDGRDRAENASPSEWLTCSGYRTRLSRLVKQDREGKGGAERKQECQNHSREALSFDG